MSNYKVMFGLRILKNILTVFLDSFLVLYFLEVSDSNILPLGIYKLVAVCAIYTVIFGTKNFCKSKKRVNLIRIGIIINLIYFITILILREKVVDYIVLIGLLYGLEEGFYYSIYNNLESDVITNEERAKFSGSYSAINSILSVIFPLIFGSLINATGFIKSLIIILVIVAFQIILSFMIKDENIPKETKADLKGYKELTKNDKKVKAMYNTEFFNGLTYSEGAFSYIVTIYIIKVFSNSVSLGIFTAIFSLISALVGILYAKCIKPKYYNIIIKISMTFTIALLCMMIYKCNYVTIILFNLVQSFSKGLIVLINSNCQSNISNLKDIKDKYKVEYWLGCETQIFKGRIISNSLFILVAFIGADAMMYLFAVLLALFGLSSIKLQNTLDENGININESISEKGQDNGDSI